MTGPPTLDRRAWLEVWGARVARPGTDADGPVEDRPSPSADGV